MSFARALDVAQKIVAETHALAGPFDKAGNVGHDEAALAEADDAEVGLKGGKVVVGDLRARRRHRREDGGLAHVGETHEADVGDGFKLQGHFQRLAPLAGLGELRGLPRGGGEVLVAKAAVAAAHQRALDVCFAHVEKHAARGAFLDHRAHRHFDNHVRAGLARAAVGQTVHAVFGEELALEAEVHQRVHALGGEELHVPAAAAVAAVRPARPARISPGGRRRSRCRRRPP